MPEMLRRSSDVQQLGWRPLSGPWAQLICDINRAPQPPRRSRRRVSQAVTAGLSHRQNPDLLEGPNIVAPETDPQRVPRHDVWYAVNEELVDLVHLVGVAPKCVGEFRE